MSDAQEAKRRFPRISSEHAVLVKTLTQLPDEGFAKTRTLGPGGCMFVSQEPLGVGSHVEIRISVRGKVAQAVGRIVYETPKAPGHVEVGVEFLKLGDPDRSVIEGLFEPGGKTAPA